MTHLEQIDIDVRSLESYFRRLFDLLFDVSQNHVSAQLEGTNGETVHDYTVFVRPDMVSNIYSMFDYWLSRLCDFCADYRQLSLTRKDIKGRNDLEARHKYLTKVALLNLANVHSSYSHLDLLREVRNCLLHAGGHANAQLQGKLQRVSGISVSADLIGIGDGFIWESLNHASIYLSEIAQAQTIWTESHRNVSEN
jgi:hypothetical protein